MNETLYADGYKEGYADAESGRCLTSLSGYDSEWQRGYIAGQRDSWGVTA